MPVVVRDRRGIEPANDIWDFDILGNPATLGLAAGVGSRATRFDTGAIGDQYRKSTTSDTGWTLIVDADAAVNVTGLEGVISVKQSPYSAAGDGVTDDTSAVQAAVDALVDSAIATTSNRYSRYALYFPPGIYRITSKINFHSMQGVHVFGHPFGGLGAHPYSMSVINARGTMDAAFDLNGVGWSYFHDLAFWGTSTPSSGNCPNVLFWWRKTSTTNPVGSSTRCRFDNLFFFGDWNYAAMSLGANPASNLQTDISQCYNITFQGSNGSIYNSGTAAGRWQNGVVWGDGASANNLSHHAFGVNGYGVQYGIVCNNTSLHVRANNIQSNFCDVLFKGGKLDAGGWRSEHSKRLFESNPTATSVTGTMSLSDVRFRLDPEMDTGGILGLYGFAGELALRDLVFQGDDVSAMSPARVPHVVLGSPSMLKVTVDNIRCQQASVAEFFRLQASQGQPGVIGRSYTQENASNVTVPAGCAGEFVLGAADERIRRVYGDIGTGGATLDGDLSRYYVTDHHFRVSGLPIKTEARRLTVRTITANASATSTDDVVRMNCTSGNVTYTLPAATGLGRKLIIKRTDSSANTCTVQRAGTDLIDGAASFTLAALGVAEVIDAASGVWDRLAT